MRVNGVEIEDTFAEAFAMWGARLLVTADTLEWARTAAAAATGFATSIIGCGCEAGVNELGPGEGTPDGRPGLAVLVFAMSRKDMEKQLLGRVGQTIMTCATTACYDGLTGGERLTIGGKLRYFGDGFQRSKLLDDRRLWRVPVMDGEFVVASNRSSDSATRFRDSSARYERALVTEMGDLLRGRAIGASLAELARASFLMASFRSALKIVHPSSSTRRLDKELLALDIDLIMTALKVAQEEQFKATAKVVGDDRKDPLLVTEKVYPSMRTGDKDLAAQPEEVVGLPFGLSDMKQKPIRDESQLVERRFGKAEREEF